jgi:hypothetical protein
MHQCSLHFLFVQPGQWPCTMLWRNVQQCLPDLQVYKPQDTVLLRRQLHPKKLEQAGSERENRKQADDSEHVRKGTLWTRANLVTWKALKNVIFFGRA